MWGTRKHYIADADREYGVAVLALVNGDLDEAERAARTALKLRERTTKEDTPRIAADARMLAEILAESDARAEANALYQRALTVYRRYELQYDAAVCLHGLARLHADTEPALSRERLQLAMWIKRSILGGIHPEVLELLNELSGNATACR
ncbi:tetratricopeptide repeat protein [Cryptosporangium sp. NPDC048952]|uniref:tetratricopeptide repeat protein n=1 Tax=Cryptosporangium sp. NPDC048952 TaxID=3363961 RepID=UPI0037206B94